MRIVVILRQGYLHQPPLWSLSLELWHLACHMPFSADGPGPSNDAPRCHCLYGFARPLCDLAQARPMFEDRERPDKFSSLKFLGRSPRWLPRRANIRCQNALAYFAKTSQFQLQVVERLGEAGTVCWSVWGGAICGEDLSRSIINTRIILLVRRGIRELKIRLHISHHTD